MPHLTLCAMGPMSNHGARSWLCFLLFDEPTRFNACPFEGCRPARICACGVGTQHHKTAKAPFADLSCLEARGHHALANATAETVVPARPA